ncbi:hypothetical protein DEJ50_14570 [Streptomyces venezuelae]|uniref:Lipoprotein n=1 Tax=Streptomyces venezuelae TaxID=54571 RepID=A0A5P2D2U1_STRVZ|nr:hypothetical protein [Streptomyces venezuelae]QES48860.1 hypothetical protein DEJ50_14570 [Streptomyces venezuelae]
MAGHRLAWLAALALLTGCGGGGPVPSAADPPLTGTSATAAASPASPAPARGRTLTAADDGFTGRLAVGETAVLRLPADPSGSRPEPTVAGDSVLLIRIANVTDPGLREWEIRAVRPGTGVVTVSGGDRTPARLTFVVS